MLKRLYYKAIEYKMHWKDHVNLPISIVLKAGGSACYCSLCFVVAR